MILFDTETRERIGDYRAPGFVTWLGFHPRDGSLAIVGGVPERRRRDTCTSSTPPPNGRAARSRSAAIPPILGRPTSPSEPTPPDGRSVIVAYMRCCPAPSAPVFLRRFDARTGSPIGPAVRVAPRCFQTGRPQLSFTPDGRLFIRERRGDLRDRRGHAARRAPLSGRRLQHRYQPRRRHARARRRGRTRSPARPRLGAGAGPDRRAPRRGGQSARPSAPTGARWRPRRRARERDRLGRERGTGDRDPRGPHWDDLGPGVQPRRGHPLYGEQRRDRENLGRGRLPPARAALPHQHGQRHRASPPRPPSPSAPTGARSRPRGPTAGWT